MDDPWNLVFVLFLAGCATPADSFDRQAEHLGLRREVVVGTDFSHAVWRKQGEPGDSLHIYLDGDGIPLVAGRSTDDPTPRRSLMLRLLPLDPAPAVYLGRPCYHGLRDSPCESRLWTSARYSERVVASMAAAAHGILAQSGNARVTWIGHSGGGVLALLLAERLPGTVAVVTIGANLDIAAWTEQYRFAPLSGSLDPAARPPMPAGIVQRHYAGGRDRVVPPAVTRQGLSGGTELVIIEDYDHVCCWEQRWPALLAGVDGGTSRASYSPIRSPSEPP